MTTPRGGGGGGEPIGRRTALRLLGGALLAAPAVDLLAACTGGDPTGGAPTTSTTAAASGSGGAGAPGTVVTRSPTKADWAALRRHLDGGLSRPRDHGFTAAHALYDPRWGSLVPSAVARPGDAEAVGQCLAFAGRFGLVPAPRGGGHSYVGASSRPRSLVIDLRSMSSVSHQPNAALAHIGGGAQLADVYRVLGRDGRSVAGGTCPTVGFAGLAAGGGFGVFDRRHGLTCDALTAAELVTADGQVRTVSATAHPELFWALRGGGAARLGVVTRLTTRTFATAPVGRWLARWAWSDAAHVVRGWQRYLADAPASSWANLHLDVLADGSRSVLVIGFGPAGAEAAQLASCVEHVGRPVLGSSHSESSHLATVRSLAGSGARQSFAAGSSVPTAPFTSAGVDALLAATADRSTWAGERHAVLDPLGGAVRSTAADATAFPWRAAPFTIQWYANLPIDPRASTSAAATAWVAAARRALRRWAPGAYVNYPSPDVADARTYLGASTDRVGAAIAQADPRGVLELSSGLPKVE